MDTLAFVRAMREVDTLVKGADWAGALAKLEELGKTGELTDTQADLLAKKTAVVTSQSMRRQAVAVPSNTSAILTGLIGGVHGLQPVAEPTPAAPVPGAPVKSDDDPSTILEVGPPRVQSSDSYVTPPVQPGFAIEAVRAAPPPRPETIFITRTADDPPAPPPAAAEPAPAPSAPVHTRPRHDTLLNVGTTPSANAADPAPTTPAAQAPPAPRPAAESDGSATVMRRHDDTLFAIGTERVGQLKAAAGAPAKPAPRPDPTVDALIDLASERIKLDAQPKLDEAYVEEQYGQRAVKLFTVTAMLLLLGLLLVIGGIWTWQALTGTSAPTVVLSGTSSGLAGVEIGSRMADAQAKITAAMGKGETPDTPALISRLNGSLMISGSTAETSLVTRIAINRKGEPGTPVPDWEFKLSESSPTLHLSSPYVDFLAQLERGWEKTDDAKPGTEASKRTFTSTDTESTRTVKRTIVFARVGERGEWAAVELVIEAVSAATP